SYLTSRKFAKQCVLALLRSNSKRHRNFRAIEFFSFENATERALPLEAPRRRRPGIICIDHDQMLPTIGAVEPVLAADPCVSRLWRSGGGKIARMPGRGRISLIVIPNSRWPEGELGCARSRSAGRGFRTIQVCPQDRPGTLR